jgi:hypothetical protein
MGRFKIGQRVVLPARPEEDMVEEHGVVHAEEGDGWWLVRVDAPLYAGDDRVREVQADDMQLEVE